MTHRTKAPRRIFIAAVTALLVVGAVSAPGGERLRTKSATVEIAGGTDGTATARCGGGRRALSGGFRGEYDPEQAGAGNSPQPQHVTARRGGGRRWTTTAYNNSSTAGDLTAYAYCRAERLERKSKRTTIPGTPFMQDPEQGSATARCPRGTSAVSGGFANPSLRVTGDYENDSRVVPYLSRRRGSRGWRVSAVNAGGAEGTLVAFAYCRDGAPPPKERKSSVFETTPTELDVGSVSARCPRGRRAVSGGFAVEGIDPIVLSSRKEGRRRWEASAVVAFPGETRITSFAYCES